MIKRGQLSLFKTIKSIFAETNDAVSKIMQGFKTKSNNGISEKKLQKYVFQSFGAVLTERASKKYKKEVYNQLAMPTQLSEQESTKAFVKDVNQHIGISRKKIIQKDKLQDFTKNKTLEIASLITRMTNENIQTAQRIINAGMNAGKAPVAIENDLSENLPDVNAKRAKLIARDQYAQINSEVTRKRATQAGVKFFYYQTAKDDRVSGKPSGQYPDAKIKCYQISKQDIGYGEGIYLYEKGATWGDETHLYPGKAHINCRCTMVSLIENVNYDPVEKKQI
ncbi:MAG: phage head morphogenesis protein [Mesoflavibacter sp.]|nr:phage head morphogenesis protein [Mesoflavibacter sp.]